MVTSSWSLILQLYKHKFEAYSRNRHYSGKAIIIAYYEGVSVALFIQRANSMHSIILSTVSCLSLPYCSKLSHKWQDFQGKKDIEHKLCVLFFLIILSENFFILRSNESDIVKNLRNSSCKTPLVLVTFLRKLNVLANFRIIPKIKFDKKNPSSGCQVVP